MTTIKEIPGNSHISFTQRNKNLFLSLIASVLIIAAVIAIFSGHKINSDTKSHSSSHSIIKSTCSSTLYPDLCFSTIANSPELSIKVTTKKDVILALINRTITAVEHNFFLLQKLQKKKALTKRAKIAIHNCLELIDDTIEELHKAEDELKQYPNQKTLSEHADDLKTLLSSAITNRETCLDGFSHDKHDKKVRKFLLQPELHVEKLCSNALAMIKNLTDTDMAVEALTTRGRNLQQNKYHEGGWPKWLSAGDRKLLQSGKVTPNVVVAADGSGNFKTVAAAVAAAPSKSTVRYVIRIKAGVYRENVEVPSSKPNIMFLGDGRTKTIITASRSFGGGSTTFESATVGFIKINVDGGWCTSDIPATFGGIARDSTGNWIKGFLGRVRVENCFEAELAGILAGMQFAIQNKWAGAAVESDNADAVDFIRSRDFKAHPARTNITKIVSSFDQIQGKMLKVKREANNAADIMAKIAKESTGMIKVVPNAPSRVKIWIEADKLASKIVTGAPTINNSG